MTMSVRTTLRKRVMKFMKVDSVLAFLVHEKVTLDQDHQDQDHIERQDHNKDGEREVDSVLAMPCMLVA